MKRNLLIIICTLAFINTSYAQLTAKVDERFELTSITFSLAGVPEFCNCAVSSYWQSLDEFTTYEQSEPINFVRELNQIHGIGYNAVSAVACLLEIKNGKIRLQSQYDISNISEYDSRWTEELLGKYISMLNIFYKESKFDKFFKKHRALYDMAEKRFNEYISTVGTEWFKSFFGRQLDPNIKIYINLINGPNNYAMSDGVLLGVMGDENGLPAPGFETEYILIHEIAHHYTNPLFFSYWNKMERAANVMYPKVKQQMAAIAYGSAQTTLLEWLNNLFVLMYLKESKNEFYKANISMQIRRGFVWMGRSVDYMENFYAHRDLYPHIENFIPQLVGFLNFTADNFDLVEREYKHARPYITNIYPAPGSDITNTEEIVLTFSEPMLGSYGFNGWPEGAEPLDFSDEVEWSSDKCQAKLKLIPGKHEKSNSYGITLSGRGFISAKYFPLEDSSCVLLFNMKDL